MLRDDDDDDALNLRYVFWLSKKEKHADAMNK